MKKLLNVLVLLLCAVFVLSAGGQQEKAAEDDGIIVLTVMAPWAEAELEGFLPVLRAFEEQNPGIRVEYVTGAPADTATILANQFAVSKTPADVIDTPWSWFITQQGKKGFLADVTGVISEEEFLPSALENLIADGKLYGAPSVGGVTIPEYRKSFFEANGLKDPSTLKSWNDFVGLVTDIAAIEGVDAPLGNGGGLGWSFTSILETWIITFGSTEMHKALTKGELSWEDPSVRKVFKDNLLPLIQNGAFGEPDEHTAVREAMWNGKHGIYFGDSTDNLSLSPEEDRGVFTLPGQEAVILWNDFWFVPAFSKHPVEAKKLFRFLATEGQKIQVKNGGRIGTYANIPLESYPPSEREVFNTIKDKMVVPDMDDTIGGKFQSVIWDQAGILWSAPTEKTLDSMLSILQEASEETFANK